MGCHSSAGLYRTYDAKDPRNKTFWPQLSADFSWLPQLEAVYDAARQRRKEEPASRRLPRSACVVTDPRDRLGFPR